MSKRYEAMKGDDMPTGCCRFAVVDWTRGVEVCRAWNEEDARRISRLLNAEDHGRHAFLDAIARTD